jgi:poly-beta-1,6-N-acetyl-D-glucosamine synthase
MHIANNAFRLLGYFVMGYPIGMAVVWIVGGLLFWWRNERLQKAEAHDKLKAWPGVTILIPCHNEGDIISRTCEALLRIDYPAYHVLFIDDASRDHTSDVIREWTHKVPHFHLLRLLENQGKSNALNSALAVMGPTPVTVIMDADTLPDPLAIRILVQSLLASSDNGAVTGQPIVYNRNNVLEKIQAVEFTSIIGLIKRAQNLYGHLFSISGCITAFRTEALFQVGGFSSRTATEDIDMTWSLQKAFYRVQYSPQALAYIQVPNNLKEFWKQRKRWAIGGWHLLRTHKDIFFNWKWRRLWVIYLDMFLSILWSIFFVGGTAVWLISSLFPLWEGWGISPLPNVISILVLICVVQFVVSMKLNEPYDPFIWKQFYLVPWYPAFYFLVGALSVCRTGIKGLFQNLDSAGKWKSPTRIKAEHKQEGSIL